LDFFRDLHIFEIHTTPVRQSRIGEMDRIPAVIMDDEKPACDRLAKILNGFQQIEIKGVFTSTEESVSFILQNKPRVVFLDIEMENNISAFEVINTLNRNHCRPAVILVTCHAQYVLKALKSEVFDYIMKPVDEDELKESISRLEKYLNSSAEAIQQVLFLLSGREKEVYKLLLEGLTSEEIAGCLKISVNTVNTHRRNILEKTGARSTLDLLRMSRVR
jgi:DNA-binding NarL/FixJ family response regulator